MGNSVRVYRLCLLPIIAMGIQSLAAECDQPATRAIGSAGSTVFDAKPDKGSNQAQCAGSACQFRFDPSQKSGTRARGKLPSGPSSNVSASFTVNANADAVKMHVWKLPGFDTTLGREHSCSGGNKENCLSVRPVVYDGCVYAYAEGNGVKGGDASGDGGSKGTYFPKRGTSKACLKAGVPAKIDLKVNLQSPGKDSISLSLGNQEVIKGNNFTLSSSQLKFNQQLVHVFAGGAGEKGNSKAIACVTKPEFGGGSGSSGIGSAGLTAGASVTKPEARR